MLNNILRWAEKHSYKKNKGVLVFYMTYDPTKTGKNVFSYTVNPEMKQDEDVEEALVNAAGMIREYYYDNPDKLQYIVDIMRENGQTV